MEIIYNKVTTTDELNILVGQKADYKSLHFLYTQENIQKYKDLLLDPSSYQLIAWTENNFAGFVSASKKIFPGYLFLGELFVDPKFQGQGVGSQLVSKVIEFAKQKNLLGVYTETELINVPAQKLYEKCGFKKIKNPNWEGVTFRLQF